MNRDSLPAPETRLGWQLTVRAPGPSLIPLAPELPDATRTVFDPVSILGTTAEEARSLLRGRIVTPGEVEAVARSVYNWRKHLRDDTSYWVVTSQAARILTVTPRQVTLLLHTRRLHFITDRAGVRLMRRKDVEALVGHLH